MKKNIRHFIPCLLILLLKSALVFSQSAEQGFLAIGDTVPDFEFSIKNYKTPTAKLSDFKGKLVILDFWGVTCSACIRAMPHMQELQEKFGDKIQIIMVTKDSEEQVAKLVQRSEIVRENKLPSAINAKQLAGLFNYYTMPTHAWIDQNGALRYISVSGEATEKNIEAFLGGKDIGLREKKDLNFNLDNPLLVNWYPYQSELTFYTYMAPFNKDYNTAGFDFVHRLDNGSISRIYSSASTLMELYRLAYGILPDSKFAENRILMNFSDAEKYVSDARINDLYKQEYVYKYDLINSRTISDTQIFKFMQQQFDMTFNLKSSWQKLKRECNVIRKLPGAEQKLKSKNVPVKYFYNGTLYTMQHIKWRNFINKQSRNVLRQLIDETEIDPDLLITISIEESWDDLNVVNASLKPYGLVVTREERLMDCIVLDDQLIESAK